MTVQSQSLHGLCRPIGEVKQDCGLAIKIGQEPRGRSSGSLGLTFRLAKNNRPKLFARVSGIESNSLACYFRLNWSNLCTRL